MPNGLLIGHDKEVAAWAFSTFKVFPMWVDRAFGIVGADGSLKGAILFQNFNGVNIEMSYYGPNTLSPGIVRAIAKEVVTEFNVARGTVTTSKKNKRLIKSLHRFGFKEEGTQRCYYGSKDCVRNTAVRFVLFRNQIDKLAGVRVPTTEPKG